MPSLVRPYACPTKTYYILTYCKINSNQLYLSLTSQAPLENLAVKERSLNFEIFNPGKICIILLHMCQHKHTTAAWFCFSCPHSWEQVALWPNPLLYFEGMYFGLGTWLLPGQFLWYIRSLRYCWGNWFWCNSEHGYHTIFYPHGLTHYCVSCLAQQDCLGNHMQIQLGAKALLQGGSRAFFPVEDPPLEQWQLCWWEWS